MDKTINQPVADGFQHLKQYSKFNSVAEMNEAVKQHYEKMNATDWAVFGVFETLQTTLLIITKPLST